MEEKKYLVALHSIWFSHNKLASIFREKDNYREVFDNLDFDFLKENKFREDTIDTVLDKRKKINIDFLLKKISDKNVSIIRMWDPEYPESFTQVYNPPFLIYVRWNLGNDKKLSVIWSRNITSYGKKIISMLVPDLSKHFTIVSWWALGCDTEAHISAMDSGGHTISIIGTGIDVDYPISNKVIFDKIISTGWAIISMFPIWEKANAYNFPIRNELIATLGEGTLVIEAKEKSGTLITSSIALDLGKDVFAVPWDLGKATSEWTNTMIQRWEAKLVIKANDILEEYNLLLEWKKESKEIKFEHEIDKEIYDMLVLEAHNIDSLAEILEKASSEISFRLSMMEISWLVKRGIDGRYEIV